MDRCWKTATMPVGSDARASARATGRGDFCGSKAGYTILLPSGVKLGSRTSWCEKGRLILVRTTGGASIPRQLMRDARAALPHTFTSPMWGMTECGGVASCPLDAPEEKLFETDGLPCGAMELKVVDPDGAAVEFAIAAIPGDPTFKGCWKIAAGFCSQNCVPSWTASHVIGIGQFM